MPKQAIRHVLLILAGGSAAFLVPWTIYLQSTLPDRFGTGNWRLAWVGFDVALLTCFAVAAWLGWRRRRGVVPAMTVTAALLCCDAWFDVMLDWGGPGEWSSIAMAALAELPVAVLLASWARPLLTAGMRSRPFAVTDIELHTDPGYRRLQETLSVNGPSTIAGLAKTLSLPAHELQRMLDRLAQAGRVTRRRDGRWRVTKLNLRPPVATELADADQARLRAFYDAKYDHELRLFGWAARHREQFGSWGRGHRASTYLTERELAEFTQEYEELLTRYCLLHDSSAAGTREVAIRWYAFPQPEDASDVIGIESPNHA
ncbi:MarR family transcriptional regulator [Amycolatopsis pigmentata]|uniref:MarR family transcriptional regulator n=1 Tax=Amycolatopsis pigmentata TaxID=450801 RepID=A0ABW5G494_9PSEU